MAEISNLPCFAHQKSPGGFAGNDSIKHDSIDRVSGSNRSSKRGSPYLRKTLFVIITILLRFQPQDDFVYQLLDKNRSEGMKYFIYMITRITKFLRIWYSKMRDGLKEMGLWNSHISHVVNHD